MHGNSSDLMKVVKRMIKNNLYLEGSSSSSRILLKYEHFGNSRLRVIRLKESNSYWQILDVRGKYIIGYIPIKNENRSLRLTSIF